MELVGVVVWIVYGLEGIWLMRVLRGALSNL